MPPAACPRGWRYLSCSHGPTESLVKTGPWQRRTGNLCKEEGHPSPFSGRRPTLPLAFFSAALRPPHPPTARHPDPRCCRCPGPPPPPSAARTTLSLSDADTHHLAEHCLHRPLVLRFSLHDPPPSSWRPRRRRRHSSSSSSSSSNRRRISCHHQQLPPMAQASIPTARQNAPPCNPHITTFHCQVQCPSVPSRSRLDGSTTPLT